MWKSVGWTAVTIFGLAAVIGITGAQDEAKETGQAAKMHSYIGADGCKICHKTEKSGDQYGKWAAGPHAQAFTVLGTEKAMEVAKKAGVTGNPQEAAECLQCHVTAHGVPAEQLGPKFAKEEGVGCEACHGPGSDYKSKKVMEDREAAVAAGMLVPSEKTCLNCHNEKNPTHTGFDFKTAFAEIAHPTPESE